jgi:hypothetical protein
MIGPLAFLTTSRSADIAGAAGAAGVAGALSCSVCFGPPEHPVKTDAATAVRAAHPNARRLSPSPFFDSTPQVPQSLLQASGEICKPFNDFSIMPSPFRFVLLH